MEDDECIPDISSLHASLQAALADSLAALSSQQTRPGLNGLASTSSMDPSFVQSLFPSSSFEGDINEMQDMFQDLQEENAGKEKEGQESEDEEVDETLDDVLMECTRRLFLTEGWHAGLDRLGIEAPEEELDEMGTEYAVEKVFWTTLGEKELGSLRCEYEDQVTVSVEEGSLVINYIFVSNDDDPVVAARLILPIEHIGIELRSGKANRPETVALIVERKAAGMRFEAREIKQQNEEDTDEEVEEDVEDVFLEVDDWTWEQTATKSTKIILYGEALPISRVAFHLGKLYDSLRKDVFGVQGVKDGCEDIKEGENQVVEPRVMEYRDPDLSMDEEDEEEEEENREEDDMPRVAFEDLEPLPITDDDLAQDLFGLGNLSLEERVGESDSSLLDQVIGTLLELGMEDGAEARSVQDESLPYLDALEDENGLIGFSQEDLEFEWTEDDIAKLTSEESGRFDDADENDHQAEKNEEDVDDRPRKVRM